MQKKEALANLAGNIKSQVHSSFELYDTDEEVKVKALLLSLKVGDMYVKKLKNISVEINSILNEMKISKFKLELYEDIYSLLQKYDRYESVAVILEASLPPRPSINKAQVKMKIYSLRVVKKLSFL